MTKTSIYHLNSGLCPFDKRFWSRMPILLERQMKYLTSEYIEIWICSVDRERGFAKQEGYTAFIDSQGKLCKESFGIEGGNRADISASAKCHFHSAKGVATNAKPMKSQGILFWTSKQRGAWESKGSIGGTKWRGGHALADPHPRQGAPVR